MSTEGRDIVKSCNLLRRLTDEEIDIMLEYSNLFDKLELIMPPDNELDDTQKMLYDKLREQISELSKTIDGMDKDLFDIYRASCSGIPLDTLRSAIS